MTEGVIAFIDSNIDNKEKMSKMNVEDAIKDPNITKQYISIFKTLHDFNKEKLV